MSDSDFDTLARREVEELHEFFQRWFAGELQNDDQRFERLSKALAPEFEITAPDGKTSSRAEILQRTRRAHGSYRGGGFRISIENYRSRPLREDILFVNYEEWQEREGTRRARNSTALLQRFPDAPNGVRWLRVHETWLQESEA